MTAMFVNLPVTDLERAKAFYTAIGFTINPLFTDHNAACVVVEEDHSYFMILVREFFQTFTDLPIGDPAVNPSVGDRDLPRQPGGGRQGRRRRPRRGRLGAAPGLGLRLHVPAAAHRPRRQHPRVRLHGPGRRRAGPRGRSRTSRPEVDGRTRLRAVLRRHAGPGARGRALGPAHRPRPARRAAPLRRARRGAAPNPEQHPGGAAQGAAGGRRPPPGAALARHRLRADALRPRARARRARARRLGLQGDGRSAGGADHHPRLDDHVPPHRLPAAGGGEPARRPPTRRASVPPSCSSGWTAPPST